MHTVLNKLSIRNPIEEISMLFALIQQISIARDGKLHENTDEISSKLLELRFIWLSSFSTLDKQSTKIFDAAKASIGYSDLLISSTEISIPCSGAMPLIAEDKNHKNVIFRNKEISLFAIELIIYSTKEARSLSKAEQFEWTFFPFFFNCLFCLRL